MSIEELVIQYLGTKLDPVPVLASVPESNPNPADTPLQFCVIDKTGSSLTNHIYTSNIAIQSYAGTKLEAIRLNARMIDAMLQMIELDQITRVELNSDYDYTNTSTKQPRYQAVFVITHYYLGDVTE